MNELHLFIDHLYKTEAHDGGSGVYSQYYLFICQGRNCLDARFIFQLEFTIIGILNFEETGTPLFSAGDNGGNPFKLWVMIVRNSGI